MVSAPEFALYPEMRAHFDAVYDQLIGTDGPRGASPLIDVGSGNGSGLGAVVAGTNTTGIALDLREAAEWMGPPGFDIVLADDHFAKIDRRRGAEHLVHQPRSACCRHHHTGCTGDLRHQRRNADATRVT